MSDFNSLSPADISILASIIAIALSKGKSADEVNILGNFIAAVGASMLAIAAQQQNLTSSSSENQSSK